MHLCPLCNKLSESFFKKKDREYFLCPGCKGIFLEKRSLPDKITEVRRYREHNNDVHDPAYQKFVSPVVKAVLDDFSPEHSGLDFGAGTGPVISKMLEDNNFRIAQYDPLFHDKPGLLNTKYDYIVSCEVIEHFHHPAKEFALLRSLLKPGGKLYCMTNIYTHNIDFKTWYYKDDPTHVFFYQAETFSFIKEKYEFSESLISGKLIIFSYR